MLKIKDNVDLKELEKYGFKYRDCCEYKNCYVYEEMKGYLIQRIDTFKEILSKYKEIIGDDK